MNDAVHFIAWGYPNPFCRSYAPAQFKWSYLMRDVDCPECLEALGKLLRCDVLISLTPATEPDHPEAA